MEIFAKCRNIDETRQRIFSRGASMKIGPEKNYPENLVPIMECEKAGLIFFPEFQRDSVRKLFTFIPLNFYPYFYLYAHVSLIQIFTWKDFGIRDRFNTLLI